MTFVGGIRAAKSELAKLRVEVAERKHGGSDATLGAVIDQWLHHCETLGRSPTTLHGYIAKAKRIQVSRLASKPVAKVTSHDIDINGTPGHRGGPGHVPRGTHLGKLPVSKVALLTALRKALQRTQ